VLAFALYVVGACVFFRQQVFSGFDFFFGDGADPRLILFVHEHVYRALLGQASFLSPPEFYDLKNTLGGSDAFVLNQLVYVPLRLLGADPYLALVLCMLLLSALSFIAICGLLTRWFAVPLAVAAAAAVLVIFPNNLYEKTAHIQNFAIYFAPLLAWCTLYGVTEVHRQPRRACTAAAAAGLLYGLLLATGFYVAWFLGLGLGVFVASFALSDFSETIRWWRRSPSAVVRLLFCGLAGLALGIALFLMIYLPVLQWYGGWKMRNYLDGAYTFAQALDVGPQNLLWGSLAQWLGPLPFVGNRPIAITPIVSICILASFVLSLRGRFWIGPGAELRRRVVLAAGLAGILLILFTARVGDFSLYAVLHVLVPGAKAIRVADRVLVVVNLFGAVAIAVTLAQFAASGLGIAAGTSLKRGWHPILVGALLALLVFEQVNVGSVASISRSVDAAHFSAVRPAPADCHAFFVRAQPALTEWENQTDAMMVAHRINLPTLNGSTGIFPPGHPIVIPAPDYQRRVLAWAASRGTLDGLCRIDIPTGEWLPWTELDSGPRFAIGRSTAINNSEDWSRVLVAGWSAPEGWGVWSEGPQAELLLPPSSSADADIALEITTDAYVTASHPALTVTVTAAGEALAVWEFTHELHVRTLVLDIPHRLISPAGVQLVFQIATPESPRRLGLSDDGRLLGLGLHTIRVIR
jgi:hypothetical protein